MNRLQLSQRQHYSKMWNVLFRPSGFLSSLILYSCVILRYPGRMPWGTISQTVGFGEHRAVLEPLYKAVSGKALRAVFTVQTESSLPREAEELA